MLRSELIGKMVLCCNYKTTMALLIELIEENMPW